MEKIQVQILQKPRRRVIIKRGIRAEDYFAYCGEVGCGIWEQLLTMNSLDGEPVCLWLPEAYRTPGTSAYVQGVEQALDDSSPVPQGFDVITLPEACYLRFQGPAFEEETFEAAIGEVRSAMAAFDPAALGCVWDDTNPRIQLEPRAERGYVELRAVAAARDESQKNHSTCDYCIYRQSVN